MNAIIVTHPITGEKITITTEQGLRDFIIGMFSFKDKRQFQVSALAQHATFGQMRELLDRYDIAYEFAK